MGSVCASGGAEPSVTAEVKTESSGDMGEEDLFFDEGGQHNEFTMKELHERLDEATQARDPHHHPQRHHPVHHQLAAHTQRPAGHTCRLPRAVRPDSCGLWPLAEALGLRALAADPSKPIEPLERE